MFKKNKKLKNIFTLVFLISLQVQAKIDYKIKKSQMTKNLELISKENLYCKSTVEEFQKNKREYQRLHLIFKGLHSKKCKIALSKISQYQNYSKYISFISKSKYNEKSTKLYLLFKSIIMPSNFYLDFKIERINSQGKFKFFFKRGIFPNLHGTIIVQEILSVHHRCYFEMEVNWQGYSTKINKHLLEFFTSAITKQASKILFNISKTY